MRRRMSSKQKADWEQILQRNNLLGLTPNKDLVEQLASTIRAQAEHLNRVTSELEALKLAQSKGISARLREWWIK
jgi:hypothetical protein